MREKLIVALDVEGFDRAKELVDKLYPTVKIFKVGNQLFTSCGPDIVKAIQRKGGKVFLDLKFHDIPNTVKGAVKSATRWGVLMLTVHTSGGREMLKEAVSAANTAAKQLKTVRPKIFGVTVLTSMDNKALSDIGVDKKVKDIVLYLAKTAKDSGLDGIVASAKELPLVKKALGKDFSVITPGIRPLTHEKADQKRVVTPSEAIKKGADFIVVGRPITGAKNPKLAAEEILSEMKKC